MSPTTHAYASACSSIEFCRKENTVLRGALDPSIVHVIPNAVVASHFKPVDPQPPLPEIRSPSPLPAQPILTSHRSDHRLRHSTGISQRDRPPHRRSAESLRSPSRRQNPDRFVALFSILNSQLTSNHTGGDGPKIVELDQMRDKHQTLLGDRVELLGAVRHENVRAVSRLQHDAQLFLTRCCRSYFRELRSFSIRR